MNNIIQRWLEKRIGAPQRLPVTVNRKQLYTLPTGAGWLLLTLSLACVIASLNYTSNEALLVTLILASASILSLIMGHRILNGVTLQSIHVEPSHAGDNFTVEMEIKTKAWAKGIMVVIGNSHAAFDVDKNGVGKVRLSLPASQRGLWVLPRLCLTTRQPLGLATTWTWIFPQNIIVTIWPALEREPALLPQISTGNKHHINNAMQNQDIRSLRAYRPGDSIRQIAWKQSARSGTTFVREYDRPTGEAVIEWDKINLSYEEKLSRIATWVVEAERCGRPTKVILPNRQLGPGKGIKHRNECLDALAEMPNDQ